NTVLIINRSREVGVRKVLGSSKGHLIYQFLGETFFIAMIAFFISIPLLEIALTNANFVLGYNLSITPSEDATVILLVCIIPIMVTLMAGLYPALSMASFQPIRALKNRIYGSSGGTTIRRVLIGFQLFVSQGLVICTIIILQQIDFFNSQPLGLNTNSIVEFEIPEQHKNDLFALKSRIQRIAGVEDVTLSNTGAVSGNYWGGDFETTINGQKIKEAAQVKFIDEDYQKTYQITLVAGRNIPASDSSHLFLINEALVRAMGFRNAEDAIGIPIVYWGSKRGR
ncbi:MAG TPA: FtsX-like permease family protein, partial [Cyclobacteriaceae bacterium]|nr:FtsX-like permease family protein [Cyclobacteriaceae bacterium]